MNRSGVSGETWIVLQSLCAIDNGKQKSGENDSNCNDPEGKIVVAGYLDDIAEGYGTDPATKIATGIHHSGGSSAEVASEAHAHRPRCRQHKIHYAEAQRGEYYDGDVVFDKRHGEQGGCGNKQTAEGDPSIGFLSPVALNSALAEQAADEVADHSHDEREGCEETHLRKGESCSPNQPGREPAKIEPASEGIQKISEHDEPEIGKAEHLAPRHGNV